MVIDNLEIEIKKWDNDYFFSSEENGKKRIYTIHSPELKQKLREIIYPYGIVGKGNIQYEGKNSHGDHILYQQGKDDLPDQLTLISREIAERKKELKELDEWDKVDAEFKEMEDGFKKSETEWKKMEAEWKERESKLGVPTNYIEKHSWRSWNNDGTIGMKGMYIKGENQSQLIIFENKTASPQIQEITDEKAEQIKTENPLIQNKKDQPAEKENSQQNLSQKLENDPAGEKNNGFSLPTKIAIGGGIILIPVVLVGMVRKWKSR